MVFHMKTKQFSFGLIGIDYILSCLLYSLHVTLNCKQPFYSGFFLQQFN